MKNCKNVPSGTGTFGTKGITLIALVITIIILVILAGVVISSLTQNGLLGKTKQTEQITRYTSAKEIIEMKLMAIELDCISRNVEYNVSEIEEEMEKVENITVMQYYKKTAKLASGLEAYKRETMGLLEGVLVSVNQYQEYNFLIGENGKITKIAKGKIPENIDATEFKEVAQFEKDLNIVNGTKNETNTKANDALIGQISSLSKSGYYDITVNGETSDNTEETVNYNIHMIIHNGDLTLDGTNNVEGATLNSNTYEFGDSAKDVAKEVEVTGEDGTTKTEVQDASSMVVLKVNGDLTINENVTLTACKSEKGYGGPKGMMVYCTGTLTNNGTISMTARGARAEGQNVYLWKNASYTDENKKYEYIPKDGALGGEKTAGTIAGVTGNTGLDGIERQTRRRRSRWCMEWR